jgi:integration host factor subunit alpha
VTDTETLAEVKARFLKSKDNRKLWDQTERKRGVAMALAQYRHERGVSQKDIAERTGWDKGFVSRLEGAQGGVPETKTLARYVEACGARLGVVVIDEETAKSGRARVLEVISGAPRDRQLEGGSVTLDLPDEQWTARGEEAALVQSLLDKISDAAARGETVKLSDFGSFVVRPKTVRVGRNPKTGAKITPPRREMVFEPSNALKAKINQALKSQS